MERTKSNIEEVVSNVLSTELKDISVLTPEWVSQISDHYLRTNVVSLPYSILCRMEKGEKDTPPPGIEALRSALYQEFERYTPDEKKAFADAAETIIVKVLDIELETYIDVYGTQRFRTDTVIVYLFDSGVVNLDALSRDFYAGKMSTEDFLNFYAKSGYSVGGLSTLSHFSHLTFENPLWEESE